jgi:hypothetical protein
MDPNLVQNTKNQMDAKNNRSNPWFKSNYVNRTNSSYRKRKVLKLEQAQNKIKQSVLK